MPASSYIGGAVREVVWSETRDSGGMFTAEVGVWREGGKFVAYVKDGWTDGIRSAPHGDEQAARRDVGRLWEKFYG